MTNPLQTTSYFGNTWGLDTNSSIVKFGGDIVPYASDMNNAQPRADSGLEKRNGFQYKTPSFGGYGLYNYSRVDPVTNNLIEEMIGVGNSLYRLKQGSFIVSYTGSYTHAVLELTLQAGLVNLTLIENHAVVLNRSLGKGYDESSIEMLSATQTAVNALGTFTVSITGDTTIPSAFLDIKPYIVIGQNQSYTVNFYYVETIPSSNSTLFNDYYSRRNNSDFENVDAINMKNILLLFDGNQPKIYDGQSVYLSGIPTPDVPVSTLVQSNERSFGTINAVTDNGNGNYLIGIDSTTWHDVDFFIGKNYRFSLFGISVFNTLSVDYTNHTITVIRTVGNKVPATSDPIYSEPSYIPNLNEFKYYVTYQYEDAQGNITESTISLPTDGIIVDVNNYSIDIFYPQVSQSSGYNTNYAVVQGDQTITSSSGSATINVDDGFGGPPIFLVGDTAFFYNGDSKVLNYVSYLITAVSNTSIIVSTTDNIIVVNNDIISNNFQVNLYRSQFPHTIQTLIATIPNDPSNSKQGVFHDTNYVLDMGEYLPLDYVPTPPPSADYGTVFDQHLVVAKGNYVYWSEEASDITNSSLNFQSLNFEPFFSDFGGKISALKVSNKTLVIFFENSIFGLEGNFDTFDVRTFLITDQIGSIAHSSIQQVGQAIRFLSTTGFYTINNGTLQNVDADGVPISDSSNLNGFFYSYIKDASSLTSLKRAVAINDEKNKMYICFMPHESVATDIYSDSKSFCFTCKYDTDTWFKWTNINMSGGAVTYNNEIWWVERSKTLGLNKKLARRLYGVSNTQDYCDHTDTIKFNYTTVWENLISYSRYGNTLPVDMSLGSVTKMPVKIKAYNVKTKDEDYGYTSSIHFKSHINYIEHIYHTEDDFVFTEVGNPWGFIWGAPWGGVTDSGSIINFKTQNCVRSIKYEFINETFATNVNLTGWEVSWSLLNNKNIQE